MCGILGYTGSNISIIKKAHALQSHRGPDGEGFYNDDSISLGHNRLAIIDLDMRASQPMQDYSKSYIIVFNGEIYNYEKLKIEHLQEYPFRTQSDTEVLIALYAKYKQDLTKYLHGMYSFAIYDVKEQEIFLCRDSFGIKPLFYSVGSNGLGFASELKSLISIRSSLNQPISLNEEGLSQYLTLGYTIAPDTLYKEINILPANHSMLYDLKNKSYTITKNTEENTYLDPDALLTETVLDNLVSDVPVGIFFSGGVDSSLIVSILNSKKIDLKTFTLAIENKSADTSYAKKIADHLNIVPLVSSFDTQQFDESYKTLITNIDHPAGSTSLFQTHYLATQAIKHVKVALMGDGGDELFYGYDRSLVLQKLKTQEYTQGLHLEKLYFLLPEFKAKNYIFSKIFQFCNYSVSYYILTMSIGRGKTEKKHWFNTKKAICSLHIEPTELDRELYLSNDLLHKSDLTTSFCALEGRVPLLSNRFFLSSRSVAKQSFTQNNPKHFLKVVLSKFLPDTLIYRKKSGFGINYKKIVTKSQFIKKDFLWAKKYLNTNHSVNIKEFNEYLESCPQYIIALVVLAKSLSQNQVVYETK